MILKELKIDTWVGDATNCYIIFDEKSNETMVIDPAGDVDKIVEMIEILKRKTKIYIFNTLSRRPYCRSTGIKRKDAEVLY